MENKYVMFSIDDEKIKEISEALSNDSCKKILKLLSEKELSVSELSNELKIPINTVDYNVKKLLSVNLIEKANFFWSVKGKKMPTYRVSNKKIIIAPKKSNFKKAFFLSLFSTGIIAFLIKIYFELMQKKSFIASERLFVEKTAIESAPQVFSSYPKDNSLLFLFIGVWIGILVLFFIYKIIERREK